MIKLDTALVENLSFFLQLLQKQNASVLFRGLKILDSGVGRDPAVFSRYSFSSTTFKMLQFLQNIVIYYGKFLFVDE